MNTCIRWATTCSQKIFKEICCGQIGNFGTKNWTEKNEVCWEVPRGFVQASSSTWFKIKLVLFPTFPDFLCNRLHRHILASFILLHRFLMLLIRCDLVEFNNPVTFNKTLFLPLLHCSLKAPLVPAPIICNPHVTSCLTLVICNVILWRQRQRIWMLFDLLFFFLRPISVRFEPSWP